MGEMLVVYLEVILYKVLLLIHGEQNFWFEFFLFELSDLT